MSVRVRLLTCFAVLAACSPPAETGPSNTTSNGATNGQTVGVERCDPASDSACRLDVVLDEQPCSFDGHAPGDVPSLTAGSPDSVIDAGVSTAVFDDDTWLVATDDGRLIRDGATLFERAGVEILDVSRNAAGTALSFLEDDRLIVEFRPVDGEWREVLAVDAMGERPGGGLALEPTGLLWIALGDGGEDHQARDASTLPGSLLRVDVSVLPYRIPPDNPYADDEARRPEVWATGLRDPSRCSTSGDEVWCSDAGPSYVELNRAARQADFGWPYVDGPACLRTSCPEDQTAPVAFRLRSDECALLPGPLLPETLPGAENARVYAGVCNGRLFGVRADPTGVRQTRRIGRTSTTLVGLAVSGDAVLTLSADGTRRAWSFTDDLDAFPRTLADSGCLGEDGEFAATLVPYDVASPLWTDGAYKRRFVALPAGEAMTLREDGTIEFPDGTALLKMFSRELDDGSLQRLETRVMRERDGEWDFYTYAWEDGEARLLSGGADVAVESPSSEEPYVHHIPSRAACQSCHMASKRVLGPEVRQLTRPVQTAGGLADQVELMAQVGVLEGTARPTPLVDPFDDTAPLARRARSYLHANCAHCHRPGGWAPTSLEMDLRADTPLAETGTCGVEAGFGAVWADGDVRIDPGAPENSNLLQRMLVDNMGRMPPIGTAVPDVRGAAVVEAWIASLEGCD